MNMQQLNPYDTGEIAEPSIWQHGRKEYDRYGRVDFDGDDGSTLATVYLHRNGDGEYVLDIYAHHDDVRVAREDGVCVVTPTDVRSALQQAHSAAETGSVNEVLETLRVCRDLLEQLAGYAGDEVGS